MQYREYGKTGVKVSPIGFGMMRLPADSDGNVDEARAVSMLRAAIDNGLNYVDTAFNYHNGNSEKITGKALLDGYREKVFLATKAPAWMFKSGDDFDTILDKQLSRLQTDHIDFYLLHAMNAIAFEKKVLRYGVMERLEAAKAAGKIKYIGFSFHDKLDVFKNICDSYNWDFCQIQYNYMDRDIQAGDRGYELARKMGIPMIVMEPVKGGMLSGLPKEAQAILEEADPERSPASWALRWVGSHPGVKLVLSGMSSEEQLEDNIRTFSPFVPLGTQEEEVIGQAAKAIRARLKNNCTACRYCMPCPAGVDIPGNFAIWNEGAMYDIEEKARKAFKEKQEAGADAGLCIQCGKCEKVCPQGIGIRKDLADVVKDLSAL